MKKILCSTLLATLLISMPVYANETSDSFECVEEINTTASEAKATPEEVAELEKSIQENDVATIAGDYEPNNSIQTAFPYTQTNKIKCDGANEPFGHYNCFYTPFYLETIDDMDFFSIKLQTGYKYVAILKNVGTNEIRDMRLYFQKEDGSWWYKYPTEKYKGQSLFHFIPEYTTYYIRLSGSPAPGYDFTCGMACWFAVERDGTIDERLLPYDPKPSHALQ